MVQVKCEDKVKSTMITSGDCTSSSIGALELEALSSSIPSEILLLSIREISLLEPYDTVLIKDTWL
jgi:hypothetical protein